MNPPLRLLGIFLLVLIMAWSPPFVRKRVLLYTKNGKGYIHDNIPNAVKCFDSLAVVHKFKLTKTADPSVFQWDTLKKIDLIIFASTNNDVFDTDSQRLAFRHFIESGGKFFGIHSVVGTERNWTWFKQMMGASFSWHPQYQGFDMVKLKPSHAALGSIPTRWTKEDEVYFLKELYPGIQPFLAVDLASVHADAKDQARIDSLRGPFWPYYPIAWEHSYDGGQILITTLGHDKSDYLTSWFAEYLWRNTKYMLDKPGVKNFTKPRSATFDQVSHHLK
jgi:uncharacterized protein